MSSPAQSPRATDDPEPDAATPEENENEQTQVEGGDLTMSRDDLDPYAFEVKEQDRWLPIANGELRHLASHRCELLGPYPRPRPCRPMISARCSLTAARRRTLCCQALLHITPGTRVCLHISGESEFPPPACDLQPLESCGRLGE